MNREFIFYCPGCKQQLTKAQGEMFIEGVSYYCMKCENSYLEALAKVSVKKGFIILEDEV